VIWLRGHWQLILMTVLVFALWSTPVVIPLKILIVFMHEVSHGAAAILTGGKVESISLSMQQGGLAVTRGGNLFLIVSAGYVGSLLIGVLLFLVAVKSKLDKVVMALLGGAVLLITALYIREWFALVFGAGTGAAMLLVARFLPDTVNDLLLRLIGLTSMIYVPYDIFSDTLARPEIRSDAYMLAERFGGTTMLWGGLWLLISLVVIAGCLRYGIGARSNIAFGKQTNGPDHNALGSGPINPAPLV